MNSTMLRALTDEFIKISAGKTPRYVPTEQDKKMDKRLETQIGAGLGLLAGSHLGNTAGNAAFDAATAYEKAGPGAGQLADKLISSSKVPMHELGVMDRLANPDLSAAYAKIREAGGKEVPAVLYRHEYKTPGILGHELGHAAIEEGGGLLGGMQKHLYPHHPMTLPGVGLGAGALSGMSDNPYVQAAGIALPTLAHAPQLISEGGATLRGLRQLHQLGATKGQLARAAISTLPAFATYASMPLMTAGAAALGQGGTLSVREIYRRQKELKKQEQSPKA